MSKFIAYSVARTLACALALAPALFIAPASVADVTETKSIRFDMGFGKVDSTITERISGDRKRTDTDARCEGFLLSMVCGDMRGGEIIRLDKNLTWRLEPKKKSYVETGFPSEAQIAAARQERAALLEKLKDCPRPAASAAPDTRKCQMSAPKFDIQKTDETATIAGHLAKHSWISMAETCTNPDNGDACEFVVRIDTWLAEDPIAGVDEERAFQVAYDRKMGLDEATVASVMPQLQQYLAPYANALREAGAQAGDLHGIPLKTTVTISVGGAHCAAAKRREEQSSGSTAADAGGAAKAAAANSTSAATGTAADQAVTHAAGGSLVGSIAGAAAGAFGHSFIHGLFAKKSAPPKSAGEPAATGTVPMAQLVSITTETTSISADPIAADQFDAPAGWKRLLPPPARAGEAPSCPPVGK